MNRRQIAAFEATKAAHQAEFEKACQEVKAANRIVLEPWEAENASRRAAYDSACRAIELSNQRLINAWDAAKASRAAEHDRACCQVDAENHRRISEWEAANAPWLAEEKQWRERAAWAEAEIRGLEADLFALRPATEAKYRHRKGEASGIEASYDLARQDYKKELRRAEADSKRIQLEEYLDKALIRQAKLKAITSDRILSLESFGIETAKDVDILNHEKVPGIGPVLSKRLFDWRDKLTASFKPQQTLPVSVKNGIASRYAPVTRIRTAQGHRGCCSESCGRAGARQGDEGRVVQVMAIASSSASLNTSWLCFG
jgi:hypothetical protein